MISASLKQMPLDEGIDKYEIPKILNDITGAKVLTVNVESENAAAEGFIELSVAEQLDYNLDKFKQFIYEIISDTEKEKEDGIYTYSEITNQGNKVEFDFKLTY